MCPAINALGAFACSCWAYNAKERPCASSVLSNLNIATATIEMSHDARRGYAAEAVKLARKACPSTVVWEGGNDESEVSNSALCLQVSNSGPSSVLPVNEDAKREEPVKSNQKDWLRLIRAAGGIDADMDGSHDAGSCVTDAADSKAGVAGPRRTGPKVQADGDGLMGRRETMEDRCHRPCDICNDICDRRDG